MHFSDIPVTFLVTKLSFHEHIPLPLTFLSVVVSFWVINRDCNLSKFRDNLGFNEINQDFDQLGYQMQEQCVVKATTPYWVNELPTMTATWIVASCILWDDKIINIQKFVRFCSACCTVILLVKPLRFHLAPVLLIPKVSTECTVLAHATNPVLPQIKVSDREFLIETHGNVVALFSYDSKCISFLSFFNFLPSSVIMNYLYFPVLFYTIESCDFLRFLF